ncbi:MAG: hypothetical protein AMXMBFR47_31740 [Planctomycetota bacterium]
MSAAIHDDARVRTVRWRDLVPISRWRAAGELCLPLPWLAGSLLLAAAGRPAIALLASFYFYLCGLRLVHDVFHRTLGLSRAANEAVMLVLSGLMLGSMHAVRYNHMEHHRLCLHDNDVEGAIARQPAWRALLSGPLFPVRNHIHAIRSSHGASRAWIFAELIVTAALTAAALAAAPDSLLRYHVTAMWLGQCLSGFFCVWTVHHDCDREHFIARTIRNRLRSIATFEMFYHLEHHLFPAVPTRELPRLAKRLDEAAPELQTNRAF